MPCIHPWISRLIYTITFLLIGYIGWASLDDPATFWAPGHLSRHHTDIAQCTQCHEPFVGPTPQKCLACHSLQQFMASSRVEVSHFHEGVIKQNQSCVICHSDHQGLVAPITVGLMENPHGEFIFRVTGARSCSDCHAVEIRDNVTNFTLLENSLVQDLIREGESAHRAGRFAHCLRCHIGGQADTEEEDDD
ncbi:cytochrome c3 family protein [Candidatus Nitronereus thalassa]|uniref:Cytochrome c3 family protein n=1 Tax=Candidatus Nitronereus thalassa TaxID=3020898 RepID=A0ABU3K7J3_9BACT|nr:cytochrome c3 family protein [Candidatus Nitronereus thalassa]MDT7042387.1 cytochrome c3 family protein [Candidatus Nitronereus thalassa]